MRARVAILLALFALALGGPVSGADPDTQSEQPVAGVFPSDAASYAQMHHVSTLEAIRRLSLQKAAGALQESLELGVPGRFAGLIIDNSPTYRVVVRLTEGPPISIGEFTNNRDLFDAVSVKYVDRGFRELVEIGHRFRAIAALTPFDVEVNVEDNVVDVRVADRKALDAFLLEHGATMPVGARLVDVSALAVPAANVYGGDLIGPCTVGFGIRDNERATRGIVTAGHCPNDNSMKLCCPSTVAPFVAPEAYGGSHDEQWHTPAGFSVRNQIRIDRNGHLRNILGVTSRSGQAIGSSVYLFGFVTGAESGLLLSNTAAPGGVPNANLTFMRATAGIPNYTMVYPGDSGGPVYYGNVAYGIIQGRQLINVPNDSHYDVIYTASDFVQSGLDISILTTCC